MNIKDHGVPQFYGHILWQVCNWLDYSSWCNYIRPEVQHVLCSKLNILLGCGQCFRIGSLMPRYTTSFIQDRFKPPHQSTDELPAEDMRTCIYGIGSAGEVTRQKFWIIMTPCLGLLALEEVGVKGVILGQGDNQTIAVTCSDQMRLLRVVVYWSPLESTQKLWDTS